MGSQKFVTLLALFCLVISRATSAAVLTDIFSNELSELTDANHKFLLAPLSTASLKQSASSAQPVNQPVSAAQTAANQQTSDANNGNEADNQLVNRWKDAQFPRLFANKTESDKSQRSRQQKALNLQTTVPEFETASTTDFPNPNLNNLGSEITKILKKFFQHGYDKRVRPNYSGPPALVNVSFHIIGISSVDEVQMDFTTDFYFRQKWFDPRLEFEPVDQVDELCVGAEFAEKIWLPDTFFANEKTATFHKATTENTFIRIGSNGRVYRSIRLTVTCSCPMDLQYFPMDRQRCKIEIESYGYNTRDIDYRWESGNDSVTLNTKIELPQFKILGFRMGQEIQNLSSGDYIRLYCEIHFVRSMGYYLIQIYIPASLIVMISWVSFWLHRNATPARVALGVTTVLTMTTLMSSTNAALPKISYIKSIDVFLGTSFVMVFAALLEYASVGYIGKRIAMKRKRQQNLLEIHQHHQKVCVAAAASAAAAHAAAAVSAQEAAMDGNQHSGGGDLGLPSSELLPATTTECNDIKSLVRTKSSHGSAKRDTLDWRSQTLRSVKGRSKSAAGDQQQAAPFAVSKQINGNGFNGQATNSPQQQITLNNNVQQNKQKGQYQLPSLALGSQGPAPEFDVTQTHDMVRIIGLTPSSIDKHSRVVFPICFVCFNLMYWIIYGHISQQTDDRGTPLIPFMRS